jgi:hypothetical protein
MEDKKSKLAVLDSHKIEPSADYTHFYETFSRLEAKSVVAPMGEMIASPQGRGRLGRFLIKGLCDHYRGNYNPHYLTGLGSALWVADQYWKQPPIVINTFYQYVDFLFDSLKSEG